MIFTEARFLEFASGQRPATPRMTLMRDVMFARGAARGSTPVHEINKLLSFEDDPVLFQYALDPKLVD